MSEEIKLYAAHFAEIYDGKAPRFFKSPGRINLAGEHTDYNLGKVLPIAINHHLLIAISPNGKNSSRIYSRKFDEMISIEHAELFSTANHWANYVKGIISTMQSVIHSEIPNFDLAIYGALPVGAGLSSSAALTSGIGFALNTVFDLKIDLLQMAKLCMQTENDFVNVKCGLLDPVACLFAKKNHLLVFDCLDYSTQYIPFNFEGYKILLIDSMVRHNLAQSQHLNECYNDCYLAASVVNKYVAPANSLRNVKMEQLHAVENMITKASFNRAKYMINEMNRFDMCLHAAQQNDMNAFGKSMFQTHHELDTLYKISCPELNFIIEQCLQNKNIVGAKMTGGGLGGCVIALVKTEHVQHFIDEMQNAFYAKFDLQCNIYTLQSDDGVGEVV